MNSTLMDQQAAVDIKTKSKLLTPHQGSFQAPTPQNTPSTPAPITSTYRPTIAPISEKMETIVTKGANKQTSGILAGNPQLMNMLQGRLGSLVGRPSGYIDSLPTEVKRRINGLKFLQSKHAELEAKFQEEILSLEKKYLELYRPLYEKRAAVVTGQTEPTEEEVTAGEKIDEKEEDKDVTGVPEFWLTALKNHIQLAEFITEKDEAVLKHLVDIRMSYIEKPGFRLEFEFSENEYFTNKVLSKTYYYQDQAGYGGDFVYDHAEGTEINWKEGKDMTVTIETKKQRHKGTNKTRVVKRTVPADTFFSFFNPPAVPADGEELDEDEAEGLDEKLEADYELGEEFKEKLIPHAVDWFTGKALSYENYDGEDWGEEDDLYEDDEDEEGDDDDEEEDDDDDDDTKPAKGEQAPECKNQ
ncbi:hypothetical protein BC936DRAFT_144209 [Jimgerdemannia flammicorona]|uniref:Nucleosome assembly protein n=1 Tax=Jimgerdemannia flammicorona TaxID=994334 RepID=A0A433DCU1_9FUNG|nr:hypothetical protein BC936DRAFT_144209 [Jimgerdemannia flammicorona]